jgi:hypothetical protein
MPTFVPVPVPDFSPPRWMVMLLGRPLAHWAAGHRARLWIAFGGLSLLLLAFVGCLVYEYSGRLPTPMSLARLRKELHRLTPAEVRRKLGPPHEQYGGGDGWVYHGICNDFSPTNLWVQPGDKIAIWFQNGRVDHLGVGPMLVETEP